MRRLTLQVGAGVAVGALIVAGALIAATRGQDGDDATASAGSQSTAAVQRRTLQSSETRDGTIGYDDQSTLLAMGRGVLTWSAPSGSDVRRGRPLYKINQEPTFLMLGSVPAYRSLGVGSSGRDVRQLERNLRALGYHGFTVDGDFTTDTSDAVSSWQDDRGVAQTGSVQLGQVEFQPHAVRMGAAAAQIGGALQPGAKIADISGVRRAVAVSLDDQDRDLAKDGDPVTVDLTTEDIRGRVTSVDATTVTSQQGDATTTYDVTVTVTDSGAGAVRDLPEGADVQVAFATETAADVLAVPVKSLLALAEGGNGVEVVTPDGGTRIVAVTTGMFADGWVEVESGAVREGDVVVVAP